jgi:hypothetical protein
MILTHTRSDHDWTVYGDNSGRPRWIVDVGLLYIFEQTHTTRDGFPMQVLYHEDIGWLVAVNTGDGEAR